MEQHQIAETEEQMYHRRPGWSRRCPFCWADVLHADRAGVMECSGCKARIAPPSTRDEEPRLLTEQGMPRWDGDERLFGEWDRYSRPGRLLDEWGSSTLREDGAPPRDIDGQEERPPRVRLQAQRGRQDDFLDAAIAEYVGQTAALRDAIEKVKVDVQRAAKVKTSARKASPQQAIARALLLDHCGEVAGEPRAKTSRRDAPPPWFSALSSACCTALRSQVSALVLLAVNALRRRGVEYLDSLDAVAPRIEREEPFANVKHALGAALGDRGASVIGRLGPTIGGAQVKHTLPSGMVLGKIAVAPSHSSSGRAPGEDGVIELVDVRAALASVRIGRRYETRQTYDGSKQVLVDPGRPLDEVELELLELVDRGKDLGRAVRKKKGGVERAAIEPMPVREAVAQLREKLTEKQARQSLARSRRALEEVLRERGLIPEARPKPPRGPRPAQPQRARPPAYDPFAVPGGV